MDEILKHVLEHPSFATVIAVSALALVLSIFAMFLRPKLKQIETLAKDVALLQGQGNAELTKVQSALDAHKKTVEALQLQTQKRAEERYAEMELARQRGDQTLQLMYAKTYVQALDTEEKLARLNPGPLHDDVVAKLKRARGDYDQLLQLLGIPY